MSYVFSTHYVYTVQPGDTLYSIAIRLGSTLPEIEQANSLYPPFTDPGLIFPGQLLVVPGGRLGYRHEVYHIISPGDTLFYIAQRYSANTDLVFGINPSLANPNLITPYQSLRVPAFIYEVTAGDSLFRISNVTGISMDSIIRANMRRASFSPDALYLGYRLLMPIPTSRNIGVFHPLPGSVIQEGSSLQGLARAFEANILYSIIDDQQTTVTPEKNIMTSAGAPEYGEFSEQIQFAKAPISAFGQLKVYTRSAKDGSLQDVVTITIHFASNSSRKKMS